MRPGLGSGLLLAAALTLNAHAATMSSVSITGTQIDNSPFTANFTVTATDGTTTDGFVYTYMDNNSTVNGAMDPLTINVGPSFDGDTLEIMDGSGLDKFFDFASNPDLLFDPGPPPMFNAGTYSGFDFACTASLKMPGMSGTLAMFQVPTTCLTNVAAVVSTVTPEPSSIALFGTGFLGVAGLVRRRFYA